MIQSEATAAGVTFTLNLTNNGNQKISDIKITDDQGNRVNGDSFALAIGENRQLTYNVVTEEERYVTFSITGVTTSGDKYEDKTKSYVVRKYIDPDLLGIQFTAAVTETLNSAGSIGVRFNINNTGTMTMTDLVISMEEAYTDENGTEQTKLNEIYRTDVVPTGSFETTQTVYVGEPRPYLCSTDERPCGQPIHLYRPYQGGGAGRAQRAGDRRRSAVRHKHPWGNGRGLHKQGPHHSAYRAGGTDCHIRDRHGSALFPRKEAAQGSCPPPRRP